MKLFFLVNPASGGGRGRKSAQLLTDYMDQQKLDYQLFTTTAPREEAQLLKKILAEKSTEDRLIIIGGDGTLSITINQLAADAAFAYIPAGSGNDFARSLQLPTDPIEGLKKILIGQSQDFYVISYRSKYLTGLALNNIGIGLDAAIVKATNSSHLKPLLNRLHLGQLSYLVAAMKVLFVKKGFGVNVAGINFENAFLFDITKHPYFGGGLRLAPTATNLSRTLELIEIDRIPTRQFPSLIRKILAGSHLTDQRVQYLKAENFQLKLASQQPVQIDGESFELMADEFLTISTEKRSIIL